MICSIHQPNYLPYPGFFDKMIKSDIFIIYDTTQFRKNSFQNRNRICSSEGWQWLTIPVKHKFGQRINEVEIDDQKLSLKNNWTKIQTLYGKSPFFKKYKVSFEEIYSKEYFKLSDLNIDLITLITRLLNISINFSKSSALSENIPIGTAALIEMCRMVGADTYLSGISGKNYLDLDMFKDSGINIIYQNYVQPKYNQFNNSDFQPGMSIIDIMFNCADETIKYLLSSEDIKI